MVATARGKTNILWGQEKGERAQDLGDTCCKEKKKMKSVSVQGSKGGTFYFLDRTGKQSNLRRQIKMQKRKRKKKEVILGWPRLIKKKQHNRRGIPLGGPTSTKRKEYFLPLVCRVV